MATSKQKEALKALTANAEELGLYDAPASTEEVTSKEIGQEATVDKQPEYVFYKTTRPVSHTFDILCKGVNINGYYSDKAGSAVMFRVPVELAEWFEKHSHVVEGFVARVE